MLVLHRLAPRARVLRQAVEEGRVLEGALGLRRAKHLCPLPFQLLSDGSRSDVRVTMSDTTVIPSLTLKSQFCLIHNRYLRYHHDVQMRSMISSCAVPPLYPNDSFFSSCALVIAGYILLP